ncbi:MAG: NTP transferase domain-containing protein [Cellvibrionales bacterium]
MQRTECTLGILAGGPGKRAGARDKGLMVVDGRLLIERTIQQQGDIFAEVLACCRDNAHVYRHFSDRVFCEFRAGEGPLLGLAALLAATETPLLAVVPCDQLVLPTCWLNTLMDNLPDGAAGVLLGDAGRHTPVGLWRTRAARNLVDALVTQGVRALGALARDASVGLAEAPGSGRDADTIADLQGERRPR